MVFFGAMLLEIVDDDRENPSFKLLLSRLYNAKVKAKTLIETFGVAHTTLRRWGEALKSDDPELLIRILAGRHHPRKLTTEILGFAKKRFSHIYPHNHYSYSQQIREEIQATFEVSLSSETLRPYFAQWKASQSHDTENKPEAPQGGSTGESEPRSGALEGLHRAGSDVAGSAACCEPASVEQLPPSSAQPDSPPEGSADAYATQESPGVFAPSERHGSVQEALPVVVGVTNRKYAEILAVAPSGGL